MIRDQIASVRTLTGAILLLLALVLAGCQTLTSSLAPPTPTPIPPTATPLPTPTPPPDPYTVAGFQAFLARVEALRSGERPSPVNRFLAQLTSAPITGGDQAIFVYQGAADRVQLIGDMNNWTPNAAPDLTRIAGTDMWYLQATFEPAARLDYKFYVNNRHFLLDSRNPRTMLGGFGPNSELAMPAYNPPPELAPPTVAIPSGAVVAHIIDSAALAQKRTVFVYQPAAQLVGAQLPALYFQDGSDYMNLIETPILLDRLIARGDIPPVVAVFIPPIRREFEYHFNDDYVRFLADELVPFIRERYETDQDPGRTATVGASSGGLAAVYAAVSRPDVFGLALGQSGAYAVEGDRLLGRIAGGRAAATRLYLVVGTYETAVAGNDQVGNILAANRRLADLLRARGIAFGYDEAAQGHSWGLWRDYLGVGLRYLLAPVGAG